MAAPTPSSIEASSAGPSPSEETSAAEIPVVVRGFITDPKLVGYQLLTNYESTYWRVLVGNDAWSLYEVLRSFCHDGHNSCHPSINFLMILLGIKERRILTGRHTTVNGTEYHYPGLIDILQAHRLLVAAVEGSGPTLRYIFHLGLTPPLLREEQLAQLPELLQKKHVALLARCEQEAKKLQAKQKPPKVKKPREPHPSQGSGNLPEGSGNLPRGSGKLPDKQHPINITHSTTARASENHNNSSDTTDNFVVALLTHQGIAGKVADRLARRYSRERIEEKIAYLEFLQAEDPNKVQNPRGWLRRAIEEDYAPPDGFVPQVDRERLAAEAERQAQEEAEQERLRAATRQAFQETKKAEGAARGQVLAAQYGTTQREVDLWQQVLSDLKLQLPAGTFHTYLADTVLLSVTEDQAVVGLTDPRAKDWVENRLSKRIRDILALSLGGRKVTVRWVNLAGYATPAAGDTDAAVDHLDQLPVAVAA